MRHPVHCLAFVLASLLASAALGAQITLEACTPDESSVGTALAIDVQGALGNAKPKLWLTRSDDRAAKPKKTKLKVQAVAELGKGVTRLAASFKKTKTGAGLYDLHLKPKGDSDVVFEGAFSMRDPEPMSVNPDETFSKAQVTVLGEFFGEVGKPVVRLTAALGGKAKKAKVLAGSSGDTLLVKLPKLADGAYDLSVKTKIGEGVLENALVIGAGGGSGGPQVTGTLSASFAAASDALVFTNFAVGPGKPGTTLSQASFYPGPPLHQVQLLGQRLIGQSAMTVLISVIGFEPGVTPLPITISSLGPPTQYAIASIGQVTSPPCCEPVSWLSKIGVPFSVTITSVEDGRIVGSFEGTVPPVITSAAMGDLLVTEGAFDQVLTTVETDA